jgi:hypothetical protein
MCTPFALINATIPFKVIANHVIDIVHTNYVTNYVNFILLLITLYSYLFIVAFAE